MARRTKYTPDAVDRILQAIRIGAPHSVAAQHGNVDRSTLYDWQRKYKEFADAFQAAENTAALRMVGIVTKAAQDGDWRAAVWWLERRLPDEFGRHRLEVTGAAGGPVQVAARALPPLPDHVITAILQPGAAAAGQHPYGDIPDDPELEAMLTAD